MLLAKFIREVKNEELSKDFFMWEHDKNRSNCRNCLLEFTSFKRRHHCRLCGGLFCELCTVSNCLVNGEKIDRCCNGCLRSEVPGCKIRSVIESKIGGVRADDELFDLEALSISYGSTFEPRSPASSVINPPTSGYFELINKSNSFCAVKLMKSSTPSNEFKWLWEVPRPSYAALAPGDLLNSQFGEEKQLLLFVLFGNPNIIPGDSSSINYKTDGSSSKVAACAAIENFWQYSVYLISCENKNVLLKLKSDGCVEARAGTSIERNGILGKLAGGKGSGLDFSTNISPQMLSRVA